MTIYLSNIHMPLGLVGYITQYRGLFQSVAFPDKQMRWQQLLAYCLSVYPVLCI